MTCFTRLEFDAYKADFEAVKAAPQDNTSAAKLYDAQKKFEAHKTKFEKLREDVGVKLKFLDENKVNLIYDIKYVFSSYIFMRLRLNFVSEI